MNSIFKINHQLDVPIYQQLVDAIRAAIKKGELASGQQLPTVQEVTESLGIARGTIKRVYDELERAGLVEKVQGRGTFVRYQPMNSDSRKVQAMAAIDDLLNRLEEMGFSAAEINIFLTLKLREWAEQETYVKVAVVECNSENLAQMSEQMRHIPGVDLYSYLLDSIKQYPYQLTEDFDLIITTAAHAQYLESVLPMKKRVVRIALRPSAQCLSHIIKLHPGAKVGTIGYSQRFSQLLHDTCQLYAEEAELSSPFACDGSADLESYLQGKDAILLPKDYEKYFNAQALDALRRFGGELIDCYYVMDEGSVLYLETKIKRLLEEKTI